MEELRPCPFCGGKGSMRKDEKHDVAFVRCLKCGCKTASAHRLMYDDWSEAVQIATDLWNIREGDR